MTTHDLYFLLLGKTGHGKSTTGNLLTGSRIFTISANTTSETKDVEMGVAEFEGHKLTVVDGPGLEDTDLTPVKDKEAAMTNVEKALAMCYGGADAFLFVFRFGTRFGHDDRFALKALKEIIGDRFMDHVIVVVTGGDMFQMEIEEYGCEDTFDQWWKKQRGEFGELCRDCDGRVVLVNNFERDSLKRREQVEQIVNHAIDLHTRNGRYTSECFKKAERKREKLILEQKAPILKEEFQEQICLINRDILRFSEEQSSRNKTNLKRRIEELRNEIQKDDNGHNVLIDMLTLLNNVESSLDDTVHLKELVHKIEEIRRARYTWMNFGKDIVKIGVGLSQSNPKLGLACAGVGGIGGLAAYVGFGVQENKLKGKLKELENKNTDEEI